MKQQEVRFTHQYVVLEDEDEEQIDEIYLMHPNRASRNFKISSLAVGLLVGFLVQMTTLGANVVILEVWGNEFVNTSRNDIIIFSLVWSFVTSAMAIITLGFLRALVSNFFRSLPIEANMRYVTESLHADMIENMEVLFVIGALVGVSLAWVATDMFLGMQPQVNFSLITLAVALAWCKGVLWFRSRGEHENEYEDDDEEFSDDDSVLLV